MGRRRKFTTRSWISLAGLAGLLVLTSGPVSAVQLLGSNQSGALVSIDTTTGMGTLIVSFRQLCVDLCLGDAMMHGRGTAVPQEN